jgi:hypothetical protein
MRGAFNPLAYTPIENPAGRLMGYFGASLEATTAGAAVGSGVEVIAAVGGAVVIEAVMVFTIADVAVEVGEGTEFGAQAVIKKTRTTSKVNFVFMRISFQKIKPPLIPINCCLHYIAIQFEVWRRLLDKTK